MGFVSSNDLSLIFGLGGDIVIDGEEGEEDFAMENHGTGNEDDDYFDQVVGCLQEIILDP